MARPASPGCVVRVGRWKRSWHVYEGLGSVPRKKTAAHVVGEDVGGVLFGGVEVSACHVHGSVSNDLGDNLLWYASCEREDHETCAE